MLKLTSIFCLIFIFVAWAPLPPPANLPDVKLKDLNGKTVSTAAFSNNGKPIIISFWATWCKPCIQELMAIHENYPDWKAQTGVKLIAISIDDVRNSAKVAPFVKGKRWQYEVYLDENEEFKRAMNVANVPHTFLLDGKGKVVWQHNSYLPGDEDKLFAQVKKLASAK
jgi:peroxiredoxin